MNWEVNPPLDAQLWQSFDVAAKFAEQRGLSRQQIPIPVTILLAQAFSELSVALIFRQIFVLSCNVESCVLLAGVGAQHG